MLKTSASLLFFVFLFSVKTGNAQDFETLDQSLIWVNAKVIGKFDNGWKASIKAEERRYWFPDRGHQRLIPEVDIAKSFSENWQGNVGFWYFTIANPQTPFEDIDSYIREMRPYFKISYKKPTDLGSWSLRSMSEYRMFRSAEGAYNDIVFRERLRFQYVFELSSTFDLSLSEEFFFNLAGNVPFDFFDQNRIVAGLTTHLTDNLDLSTSYLHWFQPTGAEDVYFNRHIVIVGASYTFDFGG